MKSEIPVPIVTGVIVVLLVLVVGLIVWKSSPHPKAPQPGTVIRAPKMPGAGPQMAAPPKAP